MPYSVNRMAPPPWKWPPASLHQFPPRVTSPSVRLARHNGAMARRTADTPADSFRPDAVAGRGYHPCWAWLGLAGVTPFADAGPCGPALGVRRHLGRCRRQLQLWFALSEAYPTQQPSGRGSGNAQRPGELLPAGKRCTISTLMLGRRLAIPDSNRRFISARSIISRMARIY
jgi:hypothetical protein